MSPLLIISFLIFLFFVFSQFGKTIAARKSLIWWLFSLSLLWTLIYPASLRGIAHFFGVSLVSNFVIAGVLLFLMLQIIMEGVETTLQLRKIRNLVSANAFREFISQNHQTNNKKLLIISPCYNEEKNLPQHINLLKETDFDFCIIDDGSLDSSRHVLKTHSPNQFVSHATNIGVAGTLLTGFKIADELGYEFVAQCDSDGQHPTSEIKNLLEFAEKNNLDLLVASRFLEGTSNSLISTTILRRFGGLLIKYTLKLFARRVHFSDPTSGFRIYSRRTFLYLLRNMPDEYPEPETIAILAHTNFTMGETQVKMQPRVHGSSSLDFISSTLYMVKVVSAIIGLRLRNFSYFKQ